MNVFKKLRKELGLTQVDLAKKLNLKQSTICKWETGKSFPDISILKLLSNFYKVDLSTIINGENSISDYNRKNDNAMQNAQSSETLTALQQSVIKKISELQDSDVMRVSDFIQGITAKENEYFKL